MTRTTDKGVKVSVNRTFAFFMCRAPGFVFNFKSEFPLVNQFAMWCEDRRPGVWIPEMDTVPRCQPESVKAATTGGSKDEAAMTAMSILYLFNMARRQFNQFLDIDKLNRTFRSAGENTVRTAFSAIENTFGTTNIDNLELAIADVGKNIFSRRDTPDHEDLLKSANASMKANDPNSAAGTGRLYGQSDDSQRKKMAGMVSALIGAGVFIAVFMLCTIMPRIRGFR
jgi:hypothetical protein